MKINRYAVSSLLLSALILIGLSYWHFRSQRTCDGIAIYSPERDREACLKLFQDNWYWLVPEDLPFSAEKFLAKGHRSGESSEETQIAVYCVEGKVIGFVAYHKENFYKGRLRFIVLDKKYRGQGYAEKLMEFALIAMKKMGLHLVQLITRTDNESAIKFYHKIGFHEYWRDDKFVRFEKSLDQPAPATKSALA